MEKNLDKICLFLKTFIKGVDMVAYGRRAISVPNCVNEARMYKYRAWFAYTAMAAHAKVRRGSINSVADNDIGVLFHVNEGNEVKSAWVPYKGSLLPFLMTDANDKLFMVMEHYPTLRAKVNLEVSIIKILNEVFVEYLDIYSLDRVYVKVRIDDWPSIDVEKIENHFNQNVKADKNAGTFDIHISYAGDIKICWSGERIYDEAHPVTRGKVHDNLRTALRVTGKDGLHPKAITTLYGVTIDGTGPIFYIGNNAQVQEFDFFEEEEIKWLHDNVGKLDYVAGCPSLKFDNVEPFDLQKLGMTRRMLLPFVVKGADFMAANESTHLWTVEGFHKEPDVMYISDVQTLAGKYVIATVGSTVTPKYNIA